MLAIFGNPVMLGKHSSSRRGGHMYHLCIALSQDAHATEDIQAEGFQYHNYRGTIGYLRMTDHRRLTRVNI